MSRRFEAVALGALARSAYRARLVVPASMALAYLRREPAFQILTYHHVNDDDDRFFSAVPTKAFEQHMAFVARTCTVLTVEALVDAARRGRVPRRGVAITFDDGYRDTLTHAAPILAKLGLPATVFLATGFIGSGAVPWVDRLALAFKTARARECVTPWGDELPLHDEAARLTALGRCLEVLKRVPHSAVAERLHQLIDLLRPSGEPGFKNLMLTWDDVHALTGLGFSIGAHTVSHPILSRLPPSAALAEIVDSRTAIEAVLGRPPRAFAYPNGGPEDYSAVVMGLVRQAGFTCAVTTRFGVNTRWTSPYELRRGGPWELDPATFAMKLAAYRWVG